MYKLFYYYKKCYKINLYKNNFVYFLEHNINIQKNCNIYTKKSQ